MDDTAQVCVLDRTGKLAQLCAEILSPSPLSPSAFETQLFLRQKDTTPWRQRRKSTRMTKHLNKLSCHGGIQGIMQLIYYPKKVKYLSIAKDKSYLEKLHEAVMELSRQRSSQS